MRQRSRGGRSRGGGLAGGEIVPTFTIVWDSDSDSDLEPAKSPLKKWKSDREDDARREALISSGDIYVLISSSETEESANERRGQQRCPLPIARGTFGAPSQKVPPIQVQKAAQSPKENPSQNCAPNLAAASRTTRHRKRARQQPPPFIGGVDTWDRGEERLSQAGRLNAGVSVRQSSIRGGGRGVWAERAFARGELITEYAGEVLCAEEARKRTERGQFQFLATLAPGYKVIEGIREPREDCGCASFINHSATAKNAVLEAKDDKKLTHKRLFAKALRPIQAGEEVFIDYGRTYWRRHEAWCKAVAEGLHLLPDASSDSCLDSSDSNDSNDSKDSSEDDENGKKDRNDDDEENDARASRRQNRGKNRESGSRCMNDDDGVREQMGPTRRSTSLKHMSSGQKRARLKQIQELYSDFTAPIEVKRVPSQ